MMTEEEQKQERERVAVRRKALVRDTLCYLDTVHRNLTELGVGGEAMRVKTLTEDVQRKFGRFENHGIQKLVHALRNSPTGYKQVQGAPPPKDEGWR